MSHTPGPAWTFQKVPYVRGFSDAWNVYETDTEGDGRVIAHCLDEDDARLIAAAPELLAALNMIYQAIYDRQDVRDGCDGRQLPNAEMDLMAEFGDQMLQAIQKATGA